MPTTSVFSYKIEFIKFLRLKYGLGLVEAKTIVDKIAQHSEKNAELHGSDYSQDSLAYRYIFVAEKIAEKIKEGELFTSNFSLCEKVLYTGTEFVSESNIYMVKEIFLDDFIKENVPDYYRW